MKEWSCFQIVVKNSTLDHNVSSVTVRLCNQVCCFVLMKVVIQASGPQGNAVGAKGHGLRRDWGGGGVVCEIPWPQAGQRCS